MKKLFLSLAVTTAFGLTGCLADGESANVSDDETRVPFARVVFDPANGVLPVPSDILLGGTTDGTLNIPVPDAEDFGNPQNALNGLDGWSTTMPMTFEFRLPRDSEGNTVGINASSVTQADAIRVFKTVMGADMSDPDCAGAPAGTACRVEEELQYGVDFITQFEGGQAVVIPLRPLHPKTGYLVVLTDLIRDDLGRSVRPSQAFSVVANQDATLSGDTAMLQGIVGSYRNALDGFGVSTSNASYISGFTTQSVDDVAQTVRLLMADPAGPYEVGDMQGMSAGFTVGDALGLDGGDPNNAAAFAVDVYGGTLDVPYFGSTEDPLEERWQALFISAATIATAAQAGDIDIEELLPLMQRQEDFNPEDPSTFAGQIPFQAAEMAAANENDSAAVLIERDSFRHLTKFNPIPAAQTQTIPFTMASPNIAAINNVRGALGLPALDEGEPRPVVIFQHGITGERNNMLAIAPRLAVLGYSVVAIDHPLHGDRGIAGENATTGSPTAYLNLTNLLVARDNLRQSTTDLMALRFALNTATVDGVQLNPTDVTFVGHSLGGIAGTNFLSVANSPLPESLTEAYQALGGNPFAVRTAALGMPGGGIAPFLLESEQFGPQIGALLAFSEIPPFAEYALGEAESAGIVPGSPQFEAALPGYYTEFFTELAPAELVAARDGLLQQFQFAAQTVVDGADPVNHARNLVATETPILMIQAQGDDVIPNVTSYPTAGTEPLAAQLGLLPALTEATSSEDGEPISGFVNYTDAGHSSLLDPSVSSEATADMQNAIGQYFLGGSLMINIDEDLVGPSVSEQQ